MKLFYRLAPLFVSVLLIGCAANPPHNNPPGSGNAFAPAGAGFTVNMPGKAKSDLGKHGTHFFHSEVGHISYIASYIDLGTKKQLTAAQVNYVLDSVVKETRAGGNKLLSAKTITMDGHAARDVRMQLTNGVFMHTHMTLVGSRLFQVTVATDMQHANTPGITPFLDSFHITMH